MFSSKILPYLFGFTLLIFVAEIHSQCTPFDEIPKSDLSRNYSLIIDENARPLGFEKGEVPFNNEEKKEHCVTISNMTGRAVEIMFETVPEVMLCVKDATGKGDCKQGRYYDCYRSSSETMTFKFYCEVSKGCSESDISFWYRVVRGDPVEVDPEGMWCQWRNTEYPEDLQSLSPNVIIPAPSPPPPPISSASLYTVSKLSLLGMLFISIFH